MVYLGGFLADGNADGRLAATAGAGWVPPTRVFLRKSVEYIDSKGDEFFGSDKERATQCDYET
jgi:hypothetical protein